MPGNVLGPAGRPIFDSVRRRGATQQRVQSSSLEGRLVELPPFSFGIVIRSGGIRPLETPTYVLPHTFVVNKIVVSLRKLDTGSNPGPTIAFFRNGVGVWTSSKINSAVTVFDSTSGAFAPNFTLTENQQLFCRVVTEGNGQSAGLLAICRNVAA